jgi:alkylation response protein AidB-like acyl-CoA dehydrogenase
MECILKKRATGDSVPGIVRRSITTAARTRERPMSHYKSNLRDLQFNLFEAYGIDEYLGEGPFEDIDHDTAMDMLKELDRLAVEDFAESFVEADRTKLKIVDDVVELPPGVKKSLDALHDGGWHLISVPQSLGGFGAPEMLRWSAGELFAGANAAISLYPIGGLMARVIEAVGTPEQVERFAIPMVERNWGATMVLTEAEAGSDVGAGTTKATHVEGDVWHIEGVKRFITSGDNDYYENIIHLVLARRPDAPPGTKGLSMFIVPKYLINEDGSPGERNGVVTTNLEDKMGIRGSTTCELTFGMDKPAVGYLVGDVHDGIRQMFLVIEDARMSIGVKAAATLSTGYLNALEYAQERVQSADLTQSRDKTAPRVTIIHHPAVRRMLMTQKVHAEGMRALLMYAAWLLDMAHLHPEEKRYAQLNDLLLPMVKGYSSEKAYELLAQSLQVLGGSGYTRDYPMEQYIRDAKIDTIYEGTTAIQGLDLFFRKIARDQGATLMYLGQSILETVNGGSEELAAERELLGTALADVQAHVGVLVGHSMAAMQDPPEIYKTGLHTTPLLESLAEVIIGWLLIRHAEVALKALPDAGEADRAFYEGKIASARYFAKTVLPEAALRRSLAETEDGALMDLPVEAF